MDFFVAILFKYIIIIIEKLFRIIEGIFMKQLFKRNLALALTAAMIFSACILPVNASTEETETGESTITEKMEALAAASAASFDKPTASEYSAEDAAAGNYYVKIAMYSTGKCKNTSGTMYLEYYANNGQSSTIQQKWWDGALGENIWQSNSGASAEATGVVSGFPAHASCQTEISKVSVLSSLSSTYIFLALYVYNINTSEWVQIGGGQGCGGAAGSYNPDVDVNEQEDAYNTTYTNCAPYIASHSVEGISDITFTGNTVETLYIQGVAKDQYGVTFTVQPEITVEPQLSNTGITITESSNCTIFEANSSVKTQDVKVTSVYSLAAQSYLHNSASTSTANETFKITNNTKVAYKTTFYYYTTNPDDLDNPTLSSLEGAPVYENETVTIPEALNPVPTYYTSTHHYTGGTFGEMTAITGDTEYTAYGYTESEHTFEKYEIISPENNKDGTICLKCSECGYEVLAKYNEETNKFEPDSNGTETLSVPAPIINAYVNNSTGYVYSNRGASLRVDTTDSAHQFLRFTASAKLPQGAEVVDFGYLYTQSKYLFDGAEPVNNKPYNTDVFNQNTDKVFKMSCYQNTDGNYTLHNGDTYTYNIVINVSDTNWQAHYAARAFITYNYGGYEFTVYDDTYSSRTVKCIAERATASTSSETQTVKDYLQSKILNKYSTDLKMLEQSGRDIVDPDGNIVQLTGVNIGNWLLQEAWMCALNKGDADYWGEWDTENTLTTRFGEEQAQELLDTYRINFFTEEDLDYLKNLGVNCIRVPFWYENFSTSDTSLVWRTDETGNKDFSYLDWIISQCGQRNIYVILDLHGAFGFQSTNHSCGKCNSMELFTTTTNILGNVSGGSTNTTYAELNAQLWTEIATRYKDNPVVAGYDLLNEPLNNDGVTFSSGARKKIYTDYYKTVYNAIRAVDTNHLCIMEGIWEISDLPTVSENSWTNVAYSCHNYNEDETDIDTKISSYQSSTSSSSNYVPMIVGEFQPYQILDYVCEHYNNAFQYTTTKSEGGFSWFTWTYKSAKSGTSTWFMCSANVSTYIVNPESDSFETIKTKWGRMIRTNGGLVDWKYNTTMNEALAQYYKPIPGLQ